MIRSMQKTVAWGVSAVLVGGLLAGYYVWRYIAPRDAAVAHVDTPMEAPRAAPRVEPAIRYPIELAPQAANGAPATPPLPSLDASDPEIQDALARVLGRSTFARFIRPEEMVRRIVATVDNLPRKTLAPRLIPVNPVPGTFAAPASADSATIAAANAARYTPYVTAFETLDTPKLVAAYAYFYPLFQQAYRELGYPNGYFNDRLVETIDVMLSTPEVREPIPLVQPRVVYQFADPDLEALPSGQKILLRMGSDNATRVKAKLREVRRALAGQAGAAAPARAPIRPPRDPAAPDGAPASAPSTPAPSSTKASGG